MNTIWIIIDTDTNKVVTFATSALLAFSKISNYMQDCFIIGNVPADLQISFYNDLDKAFKENPNDFECMGMRAKAIEDKAVQG